MNGEMRLLREHLPTFRARQLFPAKVRFSVKLQRVPALEDLFAVRLLTFEHIFNRKIVFLFFGVCFFNVFVLGVCHFVGLLNLFVWSEKNEKHRVLCCNAYYLLLLLTLI